MPHRRVKKKRRVINHPKSVEEEGDEVLQVQSRNSLVAYEEDHGEAGCSPASHGGPY